MLQLEREAILFGPWFAVSCQRTLRVPDDGRKYPLPPGLGAFPLNAVSEYAERLPPEWRARDGVFIPMHQSEALWLGLRGAPFRPTAIKVAVGGFNVLTGAPHDLMLRADPQDYLVSPPQVWLDGIRTQRGTIRQFVAEPLGRGRTVEAALAGAEVRGGIELAVFHPRPGIFPDSPPAPLQRLGPTRSLGAAMGMGAGGEIAQRIYPDPHGLSTWDVERPDVVEVHVLNSLQFELATGLEPPPTPIDARAYSERGLPWFELYDEHRGDLAESERLSGVTTLAEYEARLQAIPAGPTPHALREQDLNVVPIRLGGAHVSPTTQIKKGE